MTTDTSAAAPYVVIDPSTGEPFTEVPMATVAQTDKAIERAHRALADWKRVTPGDRAALLRRFAQLVDDNLRNWHASRSATPATPSATRPGR